MLTNGAECVVEVRPTRVDNYLPVLYSVLYLYYVPAGMLPGWSSYFAVLCDQPVLLKVTRGFLYYLIGVT